MGAGIQLSKEQGKEKQFKSMDPQNFPARMFGWRLGSDLTGKRGTCLWSRLGAWDSKFNLTNSKGT